MKPPKPTEAARQANSINGYTPIRGTNFLYNQKRPDPHERTDDEDRREKNRRKVDLIKDLTELGNELGEVWDEV
jgi:hypothetical protein